MQENQDQIALRRWIQAGLAIPEVRALHGDAKYILNNMIAKYTLAAAAYMLSVGAERHLLSNGLLLTKSHRRSKLYGKKHATVFEHAIPATIVRRQLLETDGSEHEVREILRRAGPVVVLLRTEDQQLREGGLNSRMPPSWTWGGDELARYRETGIVLSDSLLKVDGAIKR